MGFALTSVGALGIGTASPQYALDVAGSINASQLLVNGTPLSFDAAGAAGQIQFAGPGMPPAFAASGNLFWDDANARLGIGGDISFQSSGYPLGMIQRQTDGAIDSGALVFETAELGVMAERMRIDSQGRLWMPATVSSVFGPNIFAQQAGLGFALQNISSITAPPGGGQVWINADGGVLVFPNWQGMFVYGPLNVLDVISCYRTAVGPGNLMLQIDPTANPPDPVLWVGGGIAADGLPNADPGPGSKQFWYDPGDGNRIKYSP